ncbi:MAG: N-acetylglutaminylglutamine synthetase [Myxococcales bacterium]|nr:MAG: N-acetylglutaminylglutamine synthetase [Myxococcales bacterium]
MTHHDDKVPQYDTVSASDLTKAESSQEQNGRHKPVDPAEDVSLASWVKPSDSYLEQMKRNAVLECGWGRLLFGQSFSDSAELAECLLKERHGKRDLALYIRDPHVILAQAPQRLFLDPSHTFRLDLLNYGPVSQPASITIRAIEKKRDVREINRLFHLRNMVCVDEDFVWEQRHSKQLHYLLAVNPEGEVIGVVTGVDHQAVFQDPEAGSSLWTLAVDSQTPVPGVGHTLVTALATKFKELGRHYMDLSVLADNSSAIALYEKMGFYRVPVFCIKHKHNPVNERLFVEPDRVQTLNPYAEIIANEARRRGVNVEVLDADRNHLRLTYGSRSVVCWESLSELTSSIAMVRCSDKSLTSKLLGEAGLSVPEQRVVTELEPALEFLHHHKQVVVKPLHGEQGAGVSVGVSDAAALEHAIRNARLVHEKIIVERYVQGDDLRIIVIDNKVVAAAIRKPPQVIGTGKHTVGELIEKLSRRRKAATHGESKVLVDHETLRCLSEQTLSLKSVIEKNRLVTVRKTANLHTGGTIHDVTPLLHPSLADAAVKAARALSIPVVGLDFLVEAPKKAQYVIIEANERPGLANHEPQPTAERFLDFLFPMSVSKH